MNKEKQEIAKNALKVLKELEDETKLENLIVDNKIVYKHNDEYYRVRLPNFSEQQELSTAKRKKYIEFISDDSFLFRKQWKKKYKAKGIDIDKMDEKINLYTSDMRNKLLRLAKIVNNIKEIETLKTEIEDLREKQFALSMEKTDLLSYSLEDQLMIFSNGYLTYLMLERKTEDKQWVRHYESYESFEKSNNSELINTALYYMNYLIMGNKNERDVIEESSKVE